MIQSRQTIVDLLQEGGFVLYSRHAHADVGNDQMPLNYYNCQGQRNLSEMGRSQAVSFGEAIRRLNIPVMFPVLASPMCRTRETAALAFGVDYVYVDPFWVNIYNLSSIFDVAEQGRILSNAQAALEVQPHPGMNKVIIGHSFPPGVGFGAMPDMGTVVIRPLGPGNGFEVVAYLTLEELVQI
ncbi:histidine phosphatase family protein [Halalkalibacter akibai]|uniref:Fructose-2,6-bisphosphatase n=1 Tax=Halalkalibacter akibai (strain ATCC 43226 / DSM 21942 / CIP 109018 / JCM 9157 / 1139) TaxID=1236973 RepID=W4QYW8_HALA3|nr:histidine phosphatase family protein [Halalkalibacter akibai]GAE37097.1 fructose-2,6-bisphosphatase [Halalkalibacter akibai JCM 9157]